MKLDSQQGPASLSSDSSGKEVAHKGGAEGRREADRVRTDDCDASVKGESRMTPRRQV